MDGGRDSFGKITPGSSSGGLPGPKDLYKDSRSSKGRKICQAVLREKKFAGADVVFYGKFLSRKPNVERKVFVSRYRVLKVWKGDLKGAAEVEVESPPIGDFCHSPRSNGNEGPEGVGGYALTNKSKLDQLDAEFETKKYSEVVSIS